MGWNILGAPDQNITCSHFLPTRDNRVEWPREAAEGGRITIPAVTTAVSNGHDTESAKVLSFINTSETESTDLSPEASQIALGKELFVHRWLSNDRLAGGDGLGPVYNGHSCAECHSQGGLGGAASNEHSIHAFEILPSEAGESVKSGVIHLYATSHHEKEDLATLDRYFRPGKVVAGLVLPGTKVLARKLDIDATRLVWINSPALWGVGRIDRLTTDQLEQAVRTTIQPEHAATAGRPQGRFRLHGAGRVGKFGWKAQFASLKEFVAEACANELGLSNEYARQYVPGEFRPDPEAPCDLDIEQLDALVQFVSSLPEPRQVIPDDPKQVETIRHGEQLVSKVGCTHCHTRDVGEVQNVYSDYRLHQVEDTLNASDSYYHQNFKLEIEPPDYYPQLAEWKTPALWGLADTAPYWHDGSARTIEDAILRHSRDAQAVVDSYRRLVPEDQQSILSFLNTLHGPENKNLPEVKVAWSGPE